MNEVMRVSGVHRSFTVLEREAGLRGAWKDLTTRRKKVVEAVRDISFSAHQGERIGLIGPNGAGKSTTIKMLIGVLKASRGEIEVLGCDPFHGGNSFRRQIGVVFGQRNTLFWDIPVIDTFDALRHIYRIPKPDFDARLDLLKETTKLDDLLLTPARTLSLGQRMLCNIAASMLHNPRMLLLDEPTIGLDLAVKGAMIELLRDMADTDGCTVLLSSHDMSDIEELCDRVIVIDQGRIIFDGATDDLRDLFGRRRELSFRIGDPEAVSTSPSELLAGLPVDAQDVGEQGWRIKFDAATISLEALLGRLLHELEVDELRVAEPSIQAVVRQIYEGRAVDADRSGGTG